MSKHSKLKRVNTKQAIALVIIALILGIVSYFGLQWYQDRNSIRVWFEKGDRLTPSYTVKVATTEAERQRGLMYVKPDELGTDRGMLFVFPEEKIQSFWMKDTFTSLDMIFMDSKFTVIGIIPNVPPFSLENRKVAKPSKYVLELPAGATKRDRIEEGSILKGNGNYF